jgi:preprotein translocase SecY subunit
MAQIPLFGLPKNIGPDPFFWMRTILASSRGTLMELGIGPIVTAGLIMQLLSGSQLIDVDFSNPEDRSLFTAAQKVLSVVMTVFQALVYLIGGAFGTLRPETTALIFIQLIFAGLVLMLMDELLQKGWGLGSGISLFIAAGVAEQVAWNSLGLVITPEDEKYYGALIALGQYIAEGDALTAFDRPGNLPDMTGFIATVIVFVIVVYMQSIRIEVPLQYAKYRGFKGRYPIKFFYSSNIPVILAAAFFANIYLVGQLIWSRYNKSNSNFWYNIIGTFESTDQGLNPTGGLVYYLTPPRGLEVVGADPLRAVVYLLVLIVACAIFSVTWIEVGGMAPRDVSKQLINAGMMVPGFRRSPKILEKLLKRYITPVSIWGGVAIALIAGFADYLGALGTGMGILLATMIIQQYYEIIAKERLADMHPAIADFLGLG